ncbi:heavy-metal-associated domain-containing protein [Novispirillum sp. DQ9]|uniref:heavy-metal-associated domain-containing protein n=1 Tax=Novispirillum sp. DQ9 TaxID=3398612 RepID=UPI003C7D67A3
MRKTYDVDGMTCGGCANTLRNALAKEIPSAAVTIDLAAAKVTVEPADDAAVQRAVEGAGFDYRGVAAS